jgi:major vault protein
LPDTYENIVEVVKGVVLNDKICLHLRATRDFVDVYKEKRKAGQEWLVTNKHT